MLRKKKKIFKNESFVVDWNNFEEYNIKKYNTQVKLSL